MAHHMLDELLDSSDEEDINVMPPFAPILFDNDDGNICISYAIYYYMYYQKIIFGNLT